MASGNEPIWEYWDTPSGAKSFHGKEITLVKPRPGEAMTTTYRKDYPLHELWSHHIEKPDHLNRPVAPFGHTSSYREHYVQHNITGSGAQRPGRPSPQFNPKLSATTTSRASYLPTELPPAAVAHSDRKYRPNNAPLGTTTMRADYLQWPLQAAHQRKGDGSAMPTTFDGTTTTRADYKFPAELPPAEPPKRNPPHVVPHFDGTTEYRNAYHPCVLPVGNIGHIGLQVASKPYKMGGQGGQFELMIKQGLPAPQLAQKTFTTVVDDQGCASIVVVTKRDDRPDGVVLGFFELGGLKKGPVGVAKIEVSLKLQTEKVLHAAATYIQGSKKKALTFVSAGKNSKALRSVTDVAEVP